MVWLVYTKKVRGQEFSLHPLNIPEKSCKALILEPLCDWETLLKPFNTAVLFLLFKCRQIEILVSPINIH